MINYQKWWAWIKTMVELKKNLIETIKVWTWNMLIGNQSPSLIPQLLPHVWTWIGLGGLQKGGGKKLEKSSKCPNTYGLQNLMARNFKSWKKNPSYLNWASKGLHKVEVRSLKEHKTLSLNQPNSGMHKMTTQLLIQHVACQVVVPWRCSKIGATH